jgi:arylsulfatase A-like enzyme
MSLPNVILIFADDLGYGDLGCYGGGLARTPNIDRLAREGVKFTDFYVASPVCSASRAALLTGRYPNRFGIQGALMPTAIHGMPDGETTLGELARLAGVTAGMAGKWHLGHLPAFNPLRHGFSEWLGLPYSNDMWPEKRSANPAYPPLPLMDGESQMQTIQNLDEMGTLQRRYTERAVSFIERHAGRPFFFYLAPAMPHVPLAVGERFRGRSGRGLYADVLEELDWSVGEVLSAVQRKKLERDTLVIFTSDNGPWLPYGKHAGSSGGLREGKGTCFEGGIRVPFVARWPGHIRPGSVIREPAMTIDLLPTLARLWKAPSVPKNLDGADISRLLRGDAHAKNPRQDSYFVFNNELQAIRSGRWKLILPHRFRWLGPAPTTPDGGNRIPERQVQITSPQLYDLLADPHETTDLAARHPDLVRRLTALKMTP